MIIHPQSTAYWKHYKSMKLVELYEAILFRGESICPKKIQDEIPRECSTRRERAEVETINAALTR